MSILFEIIGIAVFANIFSWHGAEITNFLMYKLKLDFKPFNCNTCLAWWLGVLWSLFLMKVTLPSMIVFASLCYLASHIVFLLLNKSKI